MFLLECFLLLLIIFILFAIYTSYSGISNKAYKLLLYSSFHWLDQMQSLMISSYINDSYIQMPEACLGHCQRSMIEIFAKIMNDF